MTDSLEPIAIVGMGCRWPGALNSPSELWSLLAAGESAKSDVPKSRFDIDGFYHPLRERPGSLNVKQGYFIDESFDKLDPSFFGLNPVETSSMDPQQRKLLEVVYESFEAAGITLEEISGTQTGCWVGNFTWDFAQSQLRDAEYLQTLNSYALTGYGLTILSNRISHVFNLLGPSSTIDTACSSAMYALHYACDALRARQCNGAVVAGTNMILTVEQQMNSAKLGILSPTSTCHTFDESADGYGRAEGVGSVYLQRLSDALDQGRPIRAVIRGTAINANGRTAGISHPSATGQESVIRTAYKAAGLDFKDTAYFECHGTGTPVGDPIEVEAIGNVFASGRSAQEPLLIGSVKPNLGHSEAASALASIMKCVLAFERDLIPPTIGVKRINPRIDLRGQRLEIVSHGRKWPASCTRRASINSFGYGGANAHVIIESLPSYLAAQHRTNSPLREPLLPPTRPVVLPFSAQSEESLNGNISNIKKALLERPIQSVACTLSRRQGSFYHRGFGIIPESSKTQQSSLEVTCTGTRRATQPVLGFVFTGQGAQWAEMGAGLMKAFPVFRSTISELDKALAGLKQSPTWSLEHLLSEVPSDVDIHDAALSQPLCTALQLGLVDLFQSWGIHPVACVGHSSGEIAAAYASKRISKTHAITAAYYRGVVTSKNVADGRMLAVAMAPEQAYKLLKLHGLDSSVAVACHNSPNSVTLSGDTEAIEKLFRLLSEERIFARILKTGGNAYHSHHMLALGEEYEELVSAAFALQEPSSVSHSDSFPRIVSSVTLKEDEVFSPSYWRRNLENPVLFSDALERLCLGDDIAEGAVHYLVELGPHPALSGSVNALRQSGKANVSNIGYSSTLKRGDDGPTSILKAIGDLYVYGFQLDFERINASEAVNEAGAITVSIPPPIVDLPPYAWNYTESIAIPASRLTREWKNRKFPRHDLLGSQLPGCSAIEPIWRNILRLNDIPWLEDHKVAGSVVFPAAGYISMAIEAATQRSGIADARAFQIHDIKFHGTLLIPSDNRGIETLLSLRPCKGENSYEFTISSVNDDVWQTHSTGEICVQEETEALHAVTPLAKVSDEFPRSFSKRKCYASLQSIGLEYGDTFSGLSDVRVQRQAGTATASLDARKSTETMLLESRYALHPSTIDQCFQLAIFAAYGHRMKELDRGFLPTHINRITVSNSDFEGKIPCELTSWFNSRQAGGFDADVVMRTKAAKALVEVERIFYTPFQHTSQVSAPERNPYLRLMWKPDIDQLTPQQAHALWPAQKGPDGDPLTRGDELALLCGAGTLDSIEHISACQTAVHLDRFKGLLKTLSGKIQAEQPSSQREKRIQELAAGLRPVLPEATLVYNLYRERKGILGGSINPLEVMTRDDMLTEVYEHGFGQRGAYTQLARMIDHAAHKNPRMKVLEIGAGTGGATRVIMKTLDGESQLRRYQSYTFTDVSAGFLEAARERFGDCKSLSFSVLDIEKSPSEQNFEPESFDLVVASNVLHATSSLTRTLQNVKFLLKPQGRVLLVETTQERPLTAYMLGALPGYWLGFEDGRKNSPFISVDAWKERLSHAGFGVPLVLEDFEKPSNSTSVILAQAGARDGPDELEQPASETVHVIHWESQCELTSALAQEGRRSLGWAVEHHALDGLSLPAQSRCVVVAEAGRNVMLNLSESEFSAIQHLCAQSASVLWVTAGGLIRGRNPESAIMWGLQRSIAAENPALHFYTLDLEPESLEDSNSAASAIVKLFGQLLRIKQPSVSHEHEFAQDAGVINVSRVGFDSELNAHFGREEKPRKMIISPQEGLSLSADLLRADSDIILQRQSLEDVPIEKGYLKLQVDALRLEQRGENHKIRVTAIAGTVTATGTDANGIRPGDRVLSYGVHDLSTVQHVPAQTCRILGLQDSCEDSVVVYPAYAFAIRCLLKLNIMRDQEALLINADVESAATPEHMAIIALALQQGISVSILVGHDSERAAYKSLCGIPTSRIHLRKDIGDVAPPSKALNLCKDTGDLLWKTMAPFGTFVDASSAALTHVEHLDLAPLRRGATLSVVVDDNSYGPSQLEGDSAGILRTLAIFSGGKGSMWQTFPLSSLQAGLQEAAGGKPVVVTVGQEAKPFLVEPSKASNYTSDGFYLFAGGLGGLGRSLVAQMIEQGARHFIFLQRSGVSGHERGNFIKDMRKAGLTAIVVRGSVSSKEDVAKAVAAATKPIRGVIQSAMALEDGLFRDMTAARYKNALAAKVHGTINLHEATLEQPLDFFVMASSMLGTLGSSTQSNYAAGNSFLDYFARYRRGLGLPATTIALGMILQVGFVNEHSNLEQILTRNGFYGIDEEEYLELMEAAMRPGRAQDDIPWSGDRLADSYILTGLEPMRLVELRQQGFAGSTFWETDIRLGNLLTSLEESGEVLKADAQVAQGDSVQVALEGAYEGGIAAVKSVVAGAVAERLSKLALFPLEQIDSTKAFTAFGVDSMIAAELRNFFFQSLGADVPFLQLMNPALSIRQIADGVAEGLYQAHQAAHLAGKETTAH